MKSTDIPKKHPVPFAKSGDKNSIPQSGGAAGAATLTDGFPPETMVSVIAGGIPPDGKDMNGVLFELSDMGRWANAGAEYTFDQNFSAAIGGYPAGAKLLSSDGKSVFISEIDDNTANPEAVSDKWVGFSNYRGAITATTGVHTLTAMEASRDLIVVSGTLTGNVQLVFPAWVKHWQIINSTTGNFSVTCKTATGSGVVVKGGFLTDIYGDGTSISSHANTDVAGVVRSVNNHEPGANGDVKLGTAADADIGTSTGNVMPVGAFGVGPAGTGRATLADLLSPDKGFTGFTWSVTGGDPDAPSFFPQGDTFGIQSQLWHNTVQYFSLQTAWRRNRIGFRMMEANVPGEWFEYFHTGRPPTATQTGALPLTGGKLTGQVIAPNFATTPNATPVGSGTYAQQLGSQAPFFQPNWQWPVTSGGVFVPIAKGTSTRKDKGWPTAITYGYLMPGEDMHAHPVIHALGDSGMENIWDFDTQTGGLRSGKAGEFATQNWVNSRCPFPVGYFMLMGNASDPNVLYPGTTWQDMNGTGYDGRVLSLGYDALGTGGSNQVTINADNLPDHSHKSGWGAPGAAYADDLRTGTDNTGNYNRSMTTETFTDGSGTTRVTNSPINVTNAYVHVRGWMRTA